MKERIKISDIIGKAIYVVFVMCMIAAISYKCNYHLDETYSYALSNQRGGMEFRIKDGKKYTSVGKMYLDYLTVRPGQRFDYSNVWRNQSEDVHPPFYYALLHTICSFFPKTFSNWFAGSINIIFAVLTLFVLRKLSRYFLDSTFLINSLSLAFALSTGVLSSATFFRMYVTAMFWVTLLAYCYVRKINENEREREFLARVSVVTLFGALTHYYCIIYAILTSVLYGVYLLLGKRYKETLRFCLAMAGTGVVSCLVFPAMIQHIFSGSRGLEVFSNAVNISDLFERMDFFWKKIDIQLFGGFSFSLILTIIILLLLYTKEKDIKECVKADSIIHNKSVMSYLLTLIPVMTYFLIVSKITVYQSERYMVPVYALSFWMALLLLVNLLHLLLPVKRANFTAVLLLCVITAGSWMNAKWPFLYLNSKTFLEKAAGYKNTDCVCLYNEKRFLIGLQFLEVKNYKSIRLMHYKDKRRIDKAIKDVKKNKPDRIIVSLIDIPASEHKKNIQYFKDFKSSQKLGSYWGTTSYVLSR